MNRSEFLAMAGKGPIPFAGTTITVTLRPDEKGDDIMEYTAARLNQYTTDADFGGGWLQHTPDEAFESIPQAIEQAVERMRNMERRAGMEPLVLTTEDDSHARRDNGRRYGIERYKDEHFTVYTLCGEEFDCPVSRPVVMDGIRYAPVYSFWLGRTVFLPGSPDGFHG